MKRTLLVVGASLLVIMGFVLGGYFPSSFIVENDVREVIVETEVTPDWAQDEDAVKAAQGVIRKKELEAMEEALVGDIAGLQSELDEVRKQLGTYWAVRDNVVAYIRATFPEHPDLFVTIAKGESGLKQWHADGRVVRGIIDPDDTGIFQINNRYWSAEAARLGLDYENSIEDNIKMARHIYEVQGVTAWVYYNDHIAMR